jgi:O-methyltransferase involved in polyketide biosynthesis
MHALLRPFNTAAAAVGGPTLDGLLLARHRVIDHLLVAAVESGAVGQVIEVAAGLSPRGWRMTRRFRQLRYLEGDLPGMVSRKRAVLAAAPPSGPGLEVCEVDALADAGPSSIGALAARLEPGTGTAVITEGLLNYFPGAQAAGMWRRFAEALGRFPAGLYLADLHLGEHLRAAPFRAFQAALGAFVRGGVYADFADEAAAARGLRDAGFDGVALHAPTEFAHRLAGLERAASARVRIVDARLGALAAA